jgi:intron-binding protein aquarius
MNDYSGRIPVNEVGEPSGTLRTITISLDPVQYHRDLLERGPDNLRRLYSSFDLVVRRHARENNFKSVLESIRDLVTDEESVEAIPSWLQDVVLGYGDPKDAIFDSMEGEEKPNNIDFKDTFMDLGHLKESFPMCDVVCSQSEDAQDDAVRPYFRISTPSSDIALKEGISSKKRKLGVDDEVIEGKTKKELIVERYYSPDPGPYPQDATPLNSVRFTPVQVRAILSGVRPGLTTIVGPPGTGKTDTAVQMIHLLYHNFPSERILIITHSNQALNDLFMKITERDVPSRHLLRLGMGEAELNTEEAYSRAGRVNAMLTRRLELLSEVERLARSLDINESVAYTCETAAHFWLLHVLSRWERFMATIQQQAGFGTVEEHFPFKTFFSNAPKPLFEGKDFQADWNRALGCFRHLRLVFQELEEIRPFEVLKSHGDRIKYLLTKQAKIIAMTCTHAAIKRREILELGFTFDTLLMEEAAQVLDVETVLPLMIQRTKDGQSSLKRVILIGDHHQLPPVVKNGALQKWCHMEQSLFTRLIRLGVPYLQLDAQGRSRPSIAALYNWRYDNLGNLPLVMDSAAFKLANPGFAYDYQLIDVPDFLGRGESEPFAYYYQNLGEAEYLVSVFQYMRLLGYPAEKISILTTYNGQCALLQDVIEKRCASHSIFGRPGAISTVDKYQGQQNDYILLSLVRTRHFGHLRDVRRLVVAMSRARLGLYVFARAGLFANCYELRPTFRQLIARPLQLALVPGEQYGNVSRNVNDEVTAPLFASGVKHMASVVENMGIELANLATQ